MIHLDIETYSEADLKLTGGHLYARDPSTEVTCLYYHIDQHTKQKLPVSWCDRTHIWRAGMPPPKIFHDAARLGIKIVAHNSDGFDAEIYRHILVARHGWHWWGYDHFIDSMAMCAAVNLPRALGQVAQALGTAEKDKVGKRLMLQLCKPAKPIKRTDNKKRLHTPEKLRRQEEYCAKDVQAERAIFHILPRLSKYENEVRLATQRMNDRGVQVDTEFTVAAKAMAAKNQDMLRGHLAKITDGNVLKETQREPFKAWIKGNGVELPTKKNPKGTTIESFDKYAIYDMLLRDDLPDSVRAALELQHGLSKSSVSKLSKIIARTCTDGRLRGSLRHMGAIATGRWSSEGAQLQNLPQGIFKDMGELQAARAMVQAGDYEMLAMCYSDHEILSIISSLIRSCFVAAPGKEFMCSDYAQIEARTILWLADDPGLDMFKGEGRIYEAMAGHIFGINPDTITKGEQRNVGKQTTLGGGFGMGPDKFLDTCHKYGIIIDRSLAARCIAGYREMFSCVPALWKSTEKAAIESIRNPGRILKCGKLKLQTKDRHLRMQLPSGRCLWMRNAAVYKKAAPWDASVMLDAIRFTGNKSSYYGIIDTWGGDIAQSATQATARDLMAGGIMRAEAAGYAPVLTIHDEVLTEVEQGTRSLDELNFTLTDVESWAAGLPVAAEGWVGSYYRKD